MRRGEVRLLLMFTIGISYAPDKPPDERITLTFHLDNEPKHAEQLGHISAVWSNLELNLYVLFEFMSGSPPAIARSIWNAVESTRGRREMVLGIGQVLIDNDSEKNILDDILRRIGKTSKHRNKYVHDTWGVADTQKHEIVHGPVLARRQDPLKAKP